LEIQHVDGPLCVHGIVVVHVGVPRKRRDKNGVMRKGGGCEKRAENTQEKVSAYPRD
jgi:hypothetical protein